MMARGVPQKEDGSRPRWSIANQELTLTVMIIPANPYLMLEASLIICTLKPLKLMRGHLDARLSVTLRYLWFAWGSALAHFAMRGQGQE